MTDKQPEALRLADTLDLAPENGIEPQTSEDAAAELRRLHTENTALQQGYAAARLEIESLQARIKTMAEEHADELMVAHLDGRVRAAQPAGAQQPSTAYAKCPIPYAVSDDGYNLFSTAQMNDYADATCALRASHGQASSQAGEYPALVCDYCGALTPDPWHSSGMLHGKMSKHIHSCDACCRGAAQAAPAPQPAPVRGTPADLPPLPDPDLRDVGTKPEDIKNFLRGYATEYAKAALAAHAPADSVLEDAARYRWLRLALADRTNNGKSHWFCSIAAGHPEELDAAIDAARKQGETNEH